MKKLILIALVALLASSSVYAAKGHLINGHQLRAYLCSIGLVSFCKGGGPTCQWKPCGGK
jgi:hypothetical protein